MVVELVNNDMESDYPEIEISRAPTGHGFGRMRGNSGRNTGRGMQVPDPGQGQQPRRVPPRPTTSTSSTTAPPTSAPTSAAVATTSAAPTTSAATVTATTPTTTTTPQDRLFDIFTTARKAAPEAPKKPPPKSRRKLMDKPQPRVQKAPRWKPAKAGKGRFRPARKTKKQVVPPNYQNVTGPGYPAQGGYASQATTTAKKPRKRNTGPAWNRRSRGWLWHMERLRTKPAPFDPTGGKAKYQTTTNPSTSSSTSASASGAAPVPNTVPTVKLDSSAQIRTFPADPRFLIRATDISTGVGVPFFHEVMNTPLIRPTEIPLNVWTPDARSQFFMRIAGATGQQIWDRLFERARMLRGVTEFAANHDSSILLRNLLYIIDREYRHVTEVRTSMHGARPSAFNANSSAPGTLELNKPKNLQGTLFEFIMLGEWLEYLDYISQLIRRSLPTVEKSQKQRRQDEHPLPKGLARAEAAAARQLKDQAIQMSEVTPSRATPFMGLPILNQPVVGGNLWTTDELYFDFGLVDEEPFTDDIFTRMWNRMALRARRLRMLMEGAATLNGPYGLYNLVAHLEYERTFVFMIRRLERVAYPEFCRGLNYPGPPRPQMTGLQQSYRLSMFWAYMEYIQFLDHLIGHGLHISRGRVDLDTNQRVPYASFGRFGPPIRARERLIRGLFRPLHWPIDQVPLQRATTTTTTTTTPTTTTTTTTTISQRAAPTATVTEREPVGDDGNGNGNGDGGNQNAETD